MESVFLVAAGQGFNLKDDEYSSIQRFVDKANLIGFNIFVAPRLFSTPSDLFERYNSVEQDYKYIVIVDQMLSPEDDVAKSMIGENLGIPFELNKTALDYINKYWGKPNVPLPEHLERLARLPKDSILLPNRLGYEQGFLIKADKTFVMVIPNEPNMCMFMLEHRILQILAGFKDLRIGYSSIVFTNTYENEVRKALDDSINETGIKAVYFFEKKDPDEIKATVTTFGTEELGAKSRAMRLVKTAVSNIKADMEPLDVQNDDQSLLSGLCKKHRITMAASVTNKELKDIMINYFRDIFKYTVNSSDREMREIVLEVPRAFLHKDEGINRGAAMHMAHSIIDIFNTQMGFSLIVEPDSAIAAVALSDKNRVMGDIFEIPKDAVGEERTAFILKYSNRYITNILSNYPCWPQDSVSIQELLDGNLRKKRFFSLDNLLAKNKVE